MFDSFFKWLPANDLNLLQEKYCILVKQCCLILLLLYAVACQRDEKSYDKKVWAEAVAIITEVEPVEKREGGKVLYGYTITYEANESVAVNNEGKLIKGPISQHGLTQIKPKKGSKVRLIYRKDEPIIFEVLEPDFLGKSE